MARAKWPEGTDELLEEILTDARGDDEQLWAFRQAFEDSVQMPADAFVVGEPVEVLQIDYDGNVRRGLTARCRLPQVARARPAHAVRGESGSTPETAQVHSRRH
jgi:hypothetical protein